MGNNMLKRYKERNMRNMSFKCTNTDEELFGWEV